MKISIVPIVFLILFLSFTTCAFAQNTKVDSLKIEVQNHKKQDTIRVNLLNDLAYSCYKKNTDEAIVYLEESEAIAKIIDFKKGRAKSLYVKAEIQAFQYNFDHGFQLFNEALKLYETKKNKIGIAKCYNSMGVLLYNKGNKNKAIDYYKKSIKIFEEIGNNKAIPTIINNIGRAYSELGNYTDAVAYYKKALSLYKEVNNEIGMAYCFNNLGVICTNQGNYPVALEYHNKSLRIAKKHTHNWLIAAALGNIGNIYNHQEHYDKAIDYYEKLLKNLKNTDKKVTAIILNNLGLVYKEKKNFKKAYETLNNAVKIHEEMNNKFDLASPLNNIGDVYLEQKEYKAAYQYFEQGKKISLEVENQRSLCNSYLGLAKINISQKKHYKALANAFKSKEISDKLELVNYQRDVSKILTIIYKNIGDYKQALKSHQQFKILNDSLFNKENIEKITQLEYEYKYKQALDSASIRELQLAKTVKTTSQDLEKTKRNYLWAIIGVLMVSMLLGSVIFYQKWRHAKAKTQNVVIEQKLLRSQMTPHFIFNSLSVLQGMILNKEEKKSVHYLSKFSKLLRITLENSRDKTVLLSQELTAINNYLELQNLEVSQSYQYTILVDDAIDESIFKIPPMLIQPFIENAIEHAFENHKESKKIDVQLKYSNKELICIIKDNGIGIDVQKEEKNKNKKSLATTITSERIKVLSKDYKIKGSISIEDRQKYNEQGTVVTLVIPYKIHAA